LTTSGEYDNKQRREAGWFSNNSRRNRDPLARLGEAKEARTGGIGMDLQKDNFEDDELSRLEDEEELGGETHEIVETEEEELAIVGEEPEEESPAPAPRPAAKKSAAKKAKKRAGPKKKAKKRAKKSKPKKKARKRARKAAKRKKRR
jgi:hypothetical protein